MKKLKLNISESNAEILSRDQLKKVIGGLNESGSEIDPNGCQLLDMACWGYINCCSGLVCTGTNLSFCKNP